MFALWGGGFLLLLTLWEILETMIIPRTVMRPGRLTTIYYQLIGTIKARAIHPLPIWKIREALLAAFGPLSVLTLVAVWSGVLVFAFASIHYGLGTRFDKDSTPAFSIYMYFSGTCFFTLGLGDLAPLQGAGRALAVVESGIGFGLLAAVISYLPTLYQAFSEREKFIVLMSNRCGGEIDGLELVDRYLRHNDIGGLAGVLQQFEEWTAMLVEMTESYPMLSFYRSQHSTRSWVGMLVAGLDACAVLRLPTDPTWPPRLREQAEISFSMGVRTLDILTSTLRRKWDLTDRRTLNIERIKSSLGQSGTFLRDDAADLAEMNRLASQYEPQAIALARYLALELPGPKN